METSAKVEVWEKWYMTGELLLVCGSREVRAEWVLSRRLGWSEADGAAEIVDGGESVEVAEIVQEVGVADARPVVETFESAKYPFDGRPPGGDERIAPPLPSRQGILVLVAAMHDAVLDTACLEGLAP